jgi:hypothetical protein
MYTTGDKLYLVTYQVRYFSEVRTKEYYTYGPNRATAETKTRQLESPERVNIIKIVSDPFGEIYHVRQIP